MESKLKENKPKSSASIFEYMMIVSGFTELFSVMIWILVGIGDEESDTWIWFSRLALGVVCFGFAGVMREIRKLREKKD